MRFGRMIRVENRRGDPDAMVYVVAEPKASKAIAIIDARDAGCLTSKWQVPVSGFATYSAVRRETHGMSGCGESRGGVSPPRAPRAVREPLDSHGSPLPL